jgi:hypothetical protein
MKVYHGSNVKIINIAPSFIYFGICRTFADN